MRAARDPAIFGSAAAPDDFYGRFDVVALIASLVGARLTQLGEPAAALNQAFVNALFQSFDDALREDGVGDLTVPKKMQRIGEAFYGRAGAYNKAITAIEAGEADGRSGLEAAIARNVLRSEPSRAAFAAPLAAHALAVRTALSQTSLEDLSEGNVAWPAFVANAVV